MDEIHATLGLETVMDQMPCTGNVGVDLTASFVATTAWAIHDDFEQRVMGHMPPVR